MAVHQLALRLVHAISQSEIEGHGVHGGLEPEAEADVLIFTLKATMHDHALRPLRTKSFAFAFCRCCLCLEEVPKIAA
jgi:hypothetical protein